MYRMQIPTEIEFKSSNQAAIPPVLRLSLGCIHYADGRLIVTLIARFMGPTWGPSGADRTQVGPMLAPWTLLSGKISRSVDSARSYRSEIWQDSWQILGRIAADSLIIKFDSKLFSNREAIHIRQSPKPYRYNHWRMWFLISLKWLLHSTKPRHWNKNTNYNNVADAITKFQSDWATLNAYLVAPGLREICQ